MNETGKGGGCTGQRHSRGKAPWREAAWPICGWREGQLGPRTESASQPTGPSPFWGPSWEHRQGASGCFQVNWNQPPSLLNNPGTSVAVAELGIGGREGRTVSRSHWPQPLKGGPQTKVKLTARGGPHVRGPGIIPGESTGPPSCCHGSWLPLILALLTASTGMTSAVSPGVTSFDPSGAQTWG